MAPSESRARCRKGCRRPNRGPVPEGDSLPQRGLPPQITKGDCTPEDPPREPRPKVSDRPVVHLKTQCGPLAWSVAGPRSGREVPLPKPPAHERDCPPQMILSINFYVRYLKKKMTCARLEWIPSTEGLLGNLLLLLKCALSRHLWVLPLKFNKKRTFLFGVSYFDFLRMPFKHENRSLILHLKLIASIAIFSRLRFVSPRSMEPI